MNNPENRYKFMPDNTKPKESESIADNSCGLPDSTKSKVYWTDDQLRAIKIRDRDIIVSASAGTGKTSVMIERILGLLQEGYSLDRMLVVTFTNAAALDMKDKLAKRLAQDNIKADVAAADIGTLHGWCKKLIGEYFYYTQLDPDFEILEGNAGQKLFSESIQAVIAEEAESNNPVFDSLTTALGGRNDEGLASALAALYNHLIIRPQFDIDLFDKEAKDKLAQIFKVRGQSLAAVARELYVATQQAEFERNVSAVFELVGCAETLTSTVLSPRTKILPEFIGLNKRYKSLKEKINALSAAAQEARDVQNSFGGFGELLLDMTKKLKAEYNRKKRAAAALDFSDLEHFALEILRSPAGAEIRKSYDFVFVDEYQDINPLQNHIIDCVKTVGRLFVVGDLKQSIYAFRGCEPQIFLDKIKKAKNPEENTEIIMLNANHRSLPAILQFNNELFCRIMTRDFGGTDYATDGKFVINGKPSTEKKENNKNGCVGIYLYQNKDETKTGIYDLTLDDGKQEDEGVKIAAQRIAAILCGETIIKDETRKAEPRDIAVLVRSYSPAIGALIKKLEGWGIKAEAGESLIDGGCKQVSALIEYLKLIDNRYDDVALINSLKSHFGDFCDDELAQIRNYCKDTEYFYQAAEGLKDQAGAKCAFAADQKYLAELALKLANFYKKLENYRLLATTVSIEELVGRVVSDVGYFQHTFLYGESAAAALDAFLNAIPSSGAASLSEFLQDLDVPGRVANAGNAVKIMTVHAAKGLEFPFVIFLDAQKQFNQTDLKKPLILFDKLLGFKNFDPENGGTGSAEWLLNKYLLQKRQKEEEMRLLYVAATRAKLSLDIVVEGKKEDAEDLEVLDGLENAEIPQDCCNRLQWLLPLYTKYAAHLPPETKTASLPDSPSFSPVFAKTLKESFDFTPKKSTLPPKTYVTALLAAEEIDRERVVYIGDGDADRAAHIGTLYHRAMEELDFAHDFWQQWQLLDDEIKKETDKSGLETAFDLMKARLEGYQVFKEQSFIVDIPADFAGFKEQGEGGSILVQGIIDVLAIKDGHAVIADYKTGNLDPKYKKQLKLYAFAAQKILGVKIESLIIYSFKEKKLFNL